jgi:nicotinamidase-related amidase
MTTLPDRPNTALVIIDVQNGVVGAAYQRDAVVANINTLVERARAADVPVIWVADLGEDRQVGSEPWKIVPELHPDDAEPLVNKRYGDAFEDTELEAILAQAGVGSLVVTGAQSDACIRSTIHGAFTRGYDVTLVGDAHTTEDFTQWGVPAPEAVISFTNIYWKYHDGPGRKAAVVDTKDIVFGG